MVSCKFENGQRINLPIPTQLARRFCYAIGKKRQHDEVLPDINWDTSYILVHVIFKERTSVHQGKQFTKARPAFHAVESMMDII